MTSSLTRRDFLQRTGCVLAGAATATLLDRGAFAAEQSDSLTLACGSATLRHAKQPDCWAALKTIGAQGIEATIERDMSFPLLVHPSRKYSAATPEDVATLKSDLQAAGCRISAILMHNRFDVEPEPEIEWAIKTAQAAQALGVPVVRIDVAPHKSDSSNFLQSSVETLKKVMSGSESTGMTFGVENHGRITNDPEFLDAMFAGVRCDRLGLTLDTANFYWFGHPLAKLYELYAKFAPRVRHTHCKNIKYPADRRDVQRPMGWKYGEYACPVYEGDIDFHRVVKILRDAGYRNDLCIENESLGKLTGPQCEAVLTKEIAYLKSCV